MLTTMNNYKPPRWPTKLLERFCAPHLLEEVMGDLHERYYLRVQKVGETKARRQYWREVLAYVRPSVLKRQHNTKSIPMDMFKNYFKIAFRNLLRHQSFSFINIGGLAVGMAVTMLIGLWVWDELSFNKYHDNYDRIAMVLQNQSYEGEVSTSFSQSMQLGAELRNNYQSYFEHVAMSSFTQNPILSYEKKAITKSGSFMEEAAPEILTLKMLKGTRTGLQDIYSILLSESTAYALFGEEEPMGKTLKIDNQFDVEVTGVYEDLPDNSSMNDLHFIAHLDLLANNGNRNVGWINNWLMVMVQLAENADIQKASMAIKDAKLKNVDQNLAKYNPELFLHPMSRWRLYSDFKNGVNTGGYIEFVWLFGIIGIFVILLACINFMNLSTARSEKRAKEVGIRKVVGSLRSQLISQFFSESFLMVFLAFLVAMVLAQLALPWFNEVANKDINMIWTNVGLWIFGLGIILVTALIAGSYPAFYLSAFRPSKVLKGTFRAGRHASLPRKILVVLQFTVSVTLIIGTTIVYQQIQFAKDRPLGYDKNGLLFIPLKTDEAKKDYNALRNELLASGTIAQLSRSECAVTDMWWSDYGLEWQGKDPNMQVNVHRGAVDFEFGETVEWKIKEGRDFSREFASDSAAMILNEAAVDYMNLEDPIGEVVKLYGREYTVIGVVEDMVSQSLFDPVQQTFYIIEPFNRFEFINVRINPQASAGKAVEAIAQTFKKYNPATPFEYTFADEQFANKYAFEERIGKLAGIFTVLAVFISCLGLFGLAAFVAEQRTKEMGIRKVLGASVGQLWQLLSKDFVVLVLVSCFIAIPIAWYFLHAWLQNYEYHTEISGWVLAVAGLGALLITILTVSFQTVKAALANPVDSLRSE